MCDTNKELLSPDDGPFGYVSTRAVRSRWDAFLYLSKHFLLLTKPKSKKSYFV